MEDSSLVQLFKYKFTISPDSIDENGHVNNVFYVQWMQDVAIRHFEFLGGVALTASLNATWVVRSHHIDYLAPAFKGEQVQARTWVVNCRRASSLRRYEFFRVSDGKLLVKGETEWVFVDSRNGRPIAIPPEISNLIPLLHR